MQIEALIHKLAEALIVAHTTFCQTETVTEEAVEAGLKIEAALDAATFYLYQQQYREQQATREFLQGLKDVSQTFVCETEEK